MCLQVCEFGLSKSWDAAEDCKSFTKVSETSISCDFLYYNYITLSILTKQSFSMTGWNSTLHATWSLENSHWKWTWAIWPKKVRHLESWSDSIHYAVGQVGCLQESVLGLESNISEFFHWPIPHIACRFPFLSSGSSCGVSRGHLSTGSSKDFGALLEKVEQAHRSEPLRLKSEIWSSPDLSEDCKQLLESMLFLDASKVSSQNKWSLWLNWFSSGCCIITLIVVRLTIVFVQSLYISLLCFHLNWYQWVLGPPGFCYSVLGSMFDAHGIEGTRI